MRRALALSLLLGVLWACDPSVVIGTCGDGGIGGGMAEGTGGGGGTATPKLRVFVTSGRFTGNLGGLSGADQKCMQAAAAGNKNGIWKAYVSSSSENALARMTADGPWYQEESDGIFFSHSTIGRIWRHTHWTNSTATSREEACGRRCTPRKLCCSFGPAHRQTAPWAPLTVKTGRVAHRQSLVCADTLSMAGLKTAPRTATVNYISSASSSNERRRGSSSQS